MRSTRRFSPVLAAAAVCALLCGSAVADELQTPAAPAAAPAERPARGMSMDRVEARFGAPSNRAPAVGDPPITRWEYPEFVVYFEHQLVIHAVGRG